MIRTITRLIGRIGSRGGGTFIEGGRFAKEGRRIEFPPGAVITHVDDGRHSSTTVEKRNLLGMPTYFFRRMGVSREPSESDMVHYTVKVGGEKTGGSCLAECSEQAIARATASVQELHDSRRFKRPRLRKAKPEITEWPHP